MIRDFVMNEIILNGNAIQAKNISFQSKKNRKKYPNNTSNTMERSPENDKFEGRKKKPGLWIGLGTVALLAVATAVEEVKEEPVVEAPKAAPVAAPKAAPTIEINDPTGKYAKRGGLFGRIFGNKK